MKCINGYISLGTSPASGVVRRGPSMGGEIAMISLPAIGGVTPLKMRGHISIVCSLPRYVLVKPEVVWLTEGNSFSMDVEVLSNTEWKIE